jgi:hypothetical protein
VPRTVIAGRRKDASESVAANPTKLSSWPPSIRRLWMLLPRAAHTLRTLTWQTAGFAEVDELDDALAAH